MVTVHFFDDPAAFLAVAAAHLAPDPVLGTVVASTTRAAAEALAAGRPRPEHPWWWVVVRDGGSVVGLAMRTAPFAPHPLYLLPMPDVAALALAGALHARGEEVAGANGALPAVRVLADELARRSGATAVVTQHTRLLELTEVVPPGPVPGRLRAAGPDDVEVAHAWLGSFHELADEQAGRPHDPRRDAHIDRADVERRVAAGTVWLWEADGEVVHLTAHQEPAYGVVRIGPVVTPRVHRGRGYARAAVAQLSQRALDDGLRPCLFTDRANAVSNRVYEAIGYRLVVDTAFLAW